MAGKKLYIDGPHASRAGYSGQITVAEWMNLRKAAPSYVTDDVLTEFANKLMLIEVDANREDAYVATRHQLAQLQGLLKIAKQDRHPFPKLAKYLANLDCSVPERHPKAEGIEAMQPILDKDGAYTGAIAYQERSTFDRIKDADRAAIQAILDRDGVFVDVDGNEHRFTLPTTDVVRPFTRHDVAVCRHRQNIDCLPVPDTDQVIRQVIVTCAHPDCLKDQPAIYTPARVWLPRGIEGFKESVSQALAELNAMKGKAGSREKPWKDELTKVVVNFWETHCPDENQHANRNSRTEKPSPIVEFAMVAFAVAGHTNIGIGGIANLLHDVIEKSSN